MIESPSGMAAAFEPLSEHRRHRMVIDRTGRKEVRLTAFVPVQQKIRAPEPFRRGQFAPLF